jgi:hypothetical protein
VHHARGDATAIETVYRAHCAGLARYLDTDPDAATDELYRELSRGRRGG